MKKFSVLLCVVGLALVSLLAGCSTAATSGPVLTPAQHPTTQHAGGNPFSMECGPEGCPIPGADGVIAPRPTGVPSTQASAKLLAP